MNFCVDLPSQKEYDAVGLGLNAVDYLVVVPHLPEFNTKVPYIAHRVAPGGQAASAMVGLARMGHRTRYIGNVGSDDIGRLQVQSLKDEGVESSGVRVINGAESQTAFIFIDQATGERTILWRRDEALTMQPADLDREAVTSGRILHLDGHDVAVSILAAEWARDAGIPVVLDIDNIYPGVERLLPLVDFLISSHSFPERMMSEPDLKAALKKLSSRTGALLVGATTGKEGVLAYFHGHYLTAPAFPIECKDTTGAGDAFHAGFIYGLLNGLSVEETLRFSNAVAALKCRDLGARTALPTLEEVQSLLSSNP